MRLAGLIIHLSIRLRVLRSLQNISDVIIVQHPQAYKTQVVTEDSNNFMRSLLESVEQKKQTSKTNQTKQAKPNRTLTRFGAFLFSFKGWPLRLLREGSSGHLTWPPNVGRQPPVSCWSSQLVRWTYHIQQIFQNIYKI